MRLDVRVKKIEKIRKKNWRESFHEKKIVKFPLITPDDSSLLTYDNNLCRNRKLLIKNRPETEVNQGFNTKLRPHYRSRARAGKLLFIRRKSKNVGICTTTILSTINLFKTLFFCLKSMF